MLFVLDIQHSHLVIALGLGTGAVFDQVQDVKQLVVIHWVLQTSLTPGPPNLDQSAGIVIAFNFRGYTFLSSK